MIELLIDAVTAVINLVDRALPEKRATPAHSPDAVEAAPPAAGHHPAGGGHPGVRTTSELLSAAICQLVWAYEADFRPAVIVELLPELRLRAAEFKAVGD